MLPQNFQEWKSCIEDACKIKLTPAFAQQRLAVYSDSAHKETKRFAEIYGQDHLNNIIQWYHQSLK